MSCRQSRGCGFQQCTAAVGGVDRGSVAQCRYRPALPTAQPAKGPPKLRPLCAASRRTPYRTCEPLCTLKWLLGPVQLTEGSGLGRGKRSCRAEGPSGVQTPRPGAHCSLVAPITRAGRAVEEVALQTRCSCFVLADWLIGICWLRGASGVPKAAGPGGAQHSQQDVCRAGKVSQNNVPKRLPCIAETSVLYS